MGYATGVAARLVTVGLVALGFAWSAPGVAQAEPDLYGLTQTGSLVRFNATAPDAASTVAPITGLPIGETMSAIAWPYYEWPDQYVPRTDRHYDQLVGLSSSGHTYAIDPASGAVTPDGGMDVNLSTGLSSAPVGGLGTALGAPTTLSPEFDGSLDAVTGDIQTSLQRLPDRLPPRPIWDGFPPPNPRPWAVDHRWTDSYAIDDAAYGTDPVVIAAAQHYLPTVGHEIQSKLYGVDGSRDTLITLEEHGSRTIGPLGVRLAGPAALVIALDGTATLVASTLSDPARSDVFSVDLSTGAATPEGALPAGTILTSIAFVPPAALALRSGGAFASEVAHMPVTRLGDPQPAITFAYEADCGVGPPPWGPCPSSGDIVTSPASGSLAPGQESAYLDIPAGDTDQSTLETSAVVVSSLTGAVTAYAAQFVVFDFGPEFAVPATATPSTAASVPVTVTRAGGGPALTLSYTTQGGSAIPGVDYQPVSGTLALGPGQTQATLAVPLLVGPHDGAIRTIGLLAGADLASSSGASVRNFDRATITIRHPAPSGAAGPPLPAAGRTGASHPFASIAGHRSGRTGLEVLVACSRPCRVRLTLWRAGTRQTLAGATARLPVSSRARYVLLRLPSRLRARLAAHPAPAVLSLTASTPGAPVLALRQTISLR